MIRWRDEPPGVGRLPVIQRCAVVRARGTRHGPVRPPVPRGQAFMMPGEMITRRAASYAPRSES